MSIIDQQIAYRKFIAQNKELINLVDNEPEVDVFSIIPYFKRGMKITQEDIDKASNPFLTSNHPVYLIHINTENPSQNLKNKIEYLQRLYQKDDIKLLLLKPNIKIASTFHYFKNQFKKPE